MSEYIDGAFKIIILAGIGVGAYYYIQCGRKLGTYAPFEVMLCLVGDVAKDVGDVVVTGAKKTGCDIYGGDNCHSDQAASESFSCKTFGTGCEKTKPSQLKCALLQSVDPFYYSSHPECNEKDTKNNAISYGQLFSDTYRTGDRMDYTKFKANCRHFGRLTGDAEWSTDGTKDLCCVRDPNAKSTIYCVYRNKSDGLLMPVRR